MPKMTPEQEAAYALDYGVARGDLSEASQLAYDRLIEQRATQKTQAQLAQNTATAASGGPLAGMPGGFYPQVPPPYWAMPGPPPALPGSMRWAAGLIWAGSCLSVVYSVVNGVVAHNLLTVQTTSTSTYSSSFVGGEIFGALIQVGLWLWMLWKTQTGRSWARVLSTVFFGIMCLQVILVLALSSPGVTKVLITVYFIVALLALIMLYQRDSSAFFSAASQARNPFGSGHTQAYGQPGYGPPGYGPPGYGPPGYGPPGYGPPGYGPPGYGPPGYSPPGYGQPAQQPGYSPPGYGQPAQQPGYSPPGYGQPAQQTGEPPQGGGLLPPQ